MFRALIVVGVVAAVVAVPLVIGFSLYGLYMLEKEDGPAGKEDPV